MMVSRSLGAPLALLLVALGGGCASTGLGGDSASQQEIRELEQRVLELQRKTAVNEVEIARLREQVAELQGRSSSRSSGASRSGTAIQQAATGESPAGGFGAAAGGGAVREEPPPVRRERMEERDIEVPSAATTPKRAGAPPLARPAAPGPGAAPSRTQAVSRTAEPPPPGATRPESITPAIQALYDRGYTLYHQGHFVDAETSFQHFLQAYPKSELADNAQYWIGECRYSRGDMKGALAAFREAIALYPEGNKVPDAMLKAGESLEKLGDHEGARAMYQEVIHRFPDTAVAAVAEERRAKLR